MAYKASGAFNRNSFLLVAGSVLKRSAAIKGVVGNIDMARLFHSSGLCHYLGNVKQGLFSFSKLKKEYHSVLAGLIAAREV